MNIEQHRVKHNGKAPKVLKVLRIESTGNFPFSGELLYLRPFSSNEEAQKEDELDNTILDNILNHYPESRFLKSVVIALEGELETILDQYRGKQESTIEIIFHPTIAINPEKIQQYDGIILEQFIKVLPVWHTASKKELDRFMVREFVLNYDYQKVKDFADSILMVRFN